VPQMFQIGSFPLESGTSELNSGDFARHAHFRAFVERFHDTSDTFIDGLPGFAPGCGARHGPGWIVVGASKRARRANGPPGKRGRARTECARRPGRFRVRTCLAKRASSQSPRACIAPQTDRP